MNFQIPRLMGFKVGIFRISPIALAVDTGISDIIITGDFNLNMLSQQTSRKIDTVCQTYSLSQIISEPTHFTEHSSSLIDLLGLL